jgi:hypothetical protein
MLPPDTAGNHRNQKAELDAMMPVVYGELRRMARSYFRHESAGHTLQPMALVHEAYMRLRGQKGVDWNNRPQFLGMA